MSTSKAIKPKRDEAPFSNWESIPERAPSVEREDRPVVARVIAMIGLFLLVLGALAIFAPFWRGPAVITPDWGYRIGSLGLILILYHTFVERDFQFRRIYGFLAIALMLAGVVLRLLAFRAASAHYFVIGGVPSLFVGLILAIAVSRNETEAHFRNLLVNMLGILGAMMIVFGLLRGAWVVDYLAVEGILVLILGLLFVGAYIGLEESSERSYKAGLALGAVGVVGFAIGLLFSILPADAIANQVPWGNFFIPSGLVLMGMSLIYVVVAMGVCVEWPIVVLARRDLAAYFFSPVAYLVFVGQMLFAWISFAIFVSRLKAFSADPRAGGMTEPIVVDYIIELIPVFVHMFFVPAITMRLLSEEKRSGTLEVMMTAPVNETSLVLGKFFAAWIFYNLLWLPWWIFLVSLRYFGNEEFDYRPILSFNVALAAISAGFISMGLFCSSMTSNQIVAAVFTFVGMMTHLVLYIAHRNGWFAGTPIQDAIQYVNFVHVWIESLFGTMSPRYLIFHVSLTIFFLFGTVKILEARKWS
jgi:gliding motility-associated transport system permease protein